MDVIRLFSEHPASVGETYGEHMSRAACFGVRMMLAGMACLVHAVLPFLFVRTGSRTIVELNDRLAVDRRVAPPIMSGERLPLYSGRAVVRCRSSHAEAADPLVQGA